MIHHKKSGDDLRDLSSLKRDIHEMPEYVRKALEDRDLMNEYLNRPPYQQNDYIGWINRAKKEETKDRRLNQMLNELDKGDVYMNMKYKPKAAF